MSLRDKAVLVSLKRGMLTASKQNAEATRLVEETYAAGVGRFAKTLLADNKLLAECKSASNAIYAYHRKHTLPWMDDGPRLITQAAYLPYLKGLKPLMSDLDAAIAALKDGWDATLDAEKQRLGPLFDAGDYPRAVDLDRHIYAIVRVLPIPDAGDFRVDLPEQEKEALNAAVKEAEQSAQADLIARLKSPLERVVTRMGEVSAALEAGEKPRIAKSLTAGITEVAEIARDLNLGDNPEVEAMIEKVARFGEAIDSRRDALKGPAPVREKVTTAATKLMADLDQLI